jgi:hypothetical protein
MNSALNFMFLLVLSAGILLPGADRSGPVRVSVNRRWLEFHGRPILPLGDSVTQGWMESGRDFDQEGYLDALARRGINVVLLWSYCATSAESQRSDPRLGYDAPEIQPWKGSPDDKSFDLTAFNQPYFDRLRQFVQYAESRNILVVLTVQDGWPKTRFAYHPFNAAMGNGPLTDCKQLVELADYEREMPADFSGGWTWQQKNQWFQERYAEKLIEELKDCSNVIFEMFNEGEWYDKEQRRRHEEHFLRFFRKCTTAPLMTNTDHVRSSEWTPRHNPAVDILSFHKKPWMGQYETFAREFRTKPARVIFESEPVPAIGGLEPAQQGQELITPEIVRRTVWERALAGAGFVAQNDTSFGWNPKCGMAKQIALRDEVYDILGHAARFFNRSGVRFWEMTPHGELTGVHCCLAQPGVEYVVYSPMGGAFTVDLSTANNKTLAVSWYDPRRGEFHAAGQVIGGNAAQQFTPSFDGDAVLHLRLATKQ